MASRVLSTTLVAPPTTLTKSRVKPSTSSQKPSSYSSSSLFKVGVRNGKITCKAVSESSQGSIDRTVYQGAFGPWTVDPEDVREVMNFFASAVDPKLLVKFCGNLFEMK